jgi:hypothetical protein
MSHTTRLGGAVLIAVLVQACSSDHGPTGPTAPTTAAAAVAPRAVISASGDITAALASFRAHLGDPNNGATPGEQPAGRREINWDAVPAAVTNTFHFPGNFFNTNSPRGALFTSANNFFRVSDNNFSDLNATYASQFRAFSPIKTFAPIMSNDMDVTWRVAGSSTPAAVTGFGVVFSDVDVAGETSMEFFDTAGQSLGVFVVPIRSDAQGFSFLGVLFPSAIVARVHIITGHGVLGLDIDVSNGGNHDLVVMDDFLYGEPHPFGGP